MDVLDVRTWVPFDVLYDRGELDYDMFMKMINAMDEKSVKAALNILSGEKGMVVLRHICYILDRVVDCDSFDNIKDLRDSVLFTVGNIIGEETIFAGDWKDNILQNIDVDGPDINQLTYNEVKNDPDLLMKFYYQYGISNQYGTSTGIPLRGGIVTSDLANIYKIEYLDKYRKEISQKYGKDVLRYKSRFPSDWKKFVDGMVDVVKNNRDQFPAISAQYNSNNIPENVVLQNFPPDKYESVDTDKINFSHEFLQFILPFNNARRRWDKKEDVDVSPPFYHPITGAPMTHDILFSRSQIKNVHEKIQNYTEAHQYHYVMERVIGHQKSFENVDTGFLDWAEEYLEKYGELTDEQIVQLRADAIRKSNMVSKMVQIQPMNMVEKHNIKYLKDKNAYYVKDPTFIFSATVPFNIPESIFENFKNSLKESIAKGIPYKGVQSTINPETKKISRVEYQILNKTNGMIEQKIITDNILLLNINKLLDTLFKEIYADQYYLNAKASAIAFSESLKKVKMILRTFKNGKTLDKSFLKLFEYDIIQINNGAKLIGVDEYSINFKNYKSIVYKLYNEYIKDYSNFSKILVNTELYGMDELMIERKKVPSKTEVDKVINGFINFALLLNNTSKNIYQANTTIHQYQEMLTARDKILREVRTEFEKTRNYLSNVFIANYARKTLLLSSIHYKSYPYVFKLLNDLFESIAPVNIEEHLKEVEESSDIMFESIIENKTQYIHKQNISHIMHGHLPLFVYENKNEFIINRPDLENDYKISKGNTLIDYNNAVETLFRYNSLIPDYTFLYPDIFVMYCIDQTKIEETDPDVTDKLSYREKYDLERLEGDRTTTVQVRDIMKNMKRINNLRENESVWNTAVKKHPPIGLPDDVKYNWILSSFDRGSYYRMIFGNYLSLYNLSKDIFNNYTQYESHQKKVEELRLGALNTYRLLIDFIGINENIVYVFDTMTPLQLLTLIEEIEIKMYLHTGNLDLESSRPIYDKTNIENILDNFGINIDKIILYNQQKYNLQETYIKKNQETLTRKYESVAYTVRLLYKAEYDIYVKKASKSKRTLTLLPVKILRELMDNDDNIKMTQYVTEKVNSMKDTSIESEYLEERKRFIITTITHFLHFLYKIYEYKKEYIKNIVEMNKLVEMNQDIRKKAEKLAMISPLKEKIETAIDQIKNRLTNNFKSIHVTLMKDLLNKYDSEKILDNNDYTHIIIDKTLRELISDPYFHNILGDNSIKELIRKDELTNESISILYILCSREKRLEQLLNDRANILKQEEQYKKSFIKIMNEIVLDKMRENKFVYGVNYDTLKKTEDVLKEREELQFTDVAADMKNLAKVISSISDIKVEKIDIAKFSPADQKKFEDLMNRYDELITTKTKLQDEYKKALKNASKKRSELKKTMKNVTANVNEGSSEEDKELAKEIISNIKKQIQIYRTSEAINNVSFKMKGTYLKNLYAGLIEITTQQNIKIGDKLPYHSGFRYIRYDFDNVNNKYIIYDKKYKDRFVNLLTAVESTNIKEFSNQEGNVFSVQLSNPLNDRSIALNYLNFSTRANAGIGIIKNIVNEKDKIFYILHDIKEKNPINIVKVGLRDIDPFKFSVMVNGKETYPLQEYYRVVLNSIKEITERPLATGGAGYPAITVREKAIKRHTIGTYTFTTHKDETPFIVRTVPNLTTLTVRASRGFQDVTINAWDIISINNEYGKNKSNSIPLGGAPERGESDAPEYFGVAERRSDEEYFDEDDDAEGEKDYDDEFVNDDDDDEQDKLEREKALEEAVDEAMKILDEDETENKYDVFYDEYYNTASDMYNLVKFTFFGQNFDRDFIPGKAFGLDVHKLAKEYKGVELDIMKKIETETSNKLLNDLSDKEINDSIVKIIKFMEVYYYSKTNNLGILKLAEVDAKVSLQNVDKEKIQRELMSLALCIIFYYDYVANLNIGQKIDHKDPPIMVEGHYMYESDGELIDYKGNIYDVYKVVDQYISNYHKNLKKDEVVAVLKKIFIILGNGTIKDDSYTYQQIAYVTTDIIKENAETLALRKDTYVKRVFNQFVMYAPSNHVLESYMDEKLNLHYPGIKNKSDLAHLDKSLYNMVNNMKNVNNDNGRILKNILIALYLTEHDSHFIGHMYNIFYTIQDLWKNKDPTYVETQLLKMYNGGYRPIWFQPFINSIIKLMDKDELFNYLDYETQRVLEGQVSYQEVGIIINESMRNAFMSFGNYSSELQTDPNLYFYSNLLVKLNLIKNSNDFSSLNDLIKYKLPGYIEQIIKNLNDKKSLLKGIIQTKKTISAPSKQQKNIDLTKLETEMEEVLEILALQNCAYIFIENQIKTEKDFDNKNENVKRCKSYWKMFEIHRENKRIRALENCTKIFEKHDIQTVQDLDQNDNSEVQKCKPYWSLYEKNKYEPPKTMTPIRKIIEYYAENPTSVIVKDIISKISKIIPINDAGKLENYIQQLQSKKNDALIDICNLMKKIALRSYTKKDIDLYQNIKNIECKISPTTNTDERENVLKFIKDALYSFKNYLDENTEDIIIDDYEEFLQSIEINIRRRLDNDEKNEILKLSLQPNKLEKYLYKLSGTYTSQDYINNMLIEINNDYNKYYPVSLQSEKSNIELMTNKFSRILKRSLTEEEKRKIEKYSSNSNYIRQYIMTIVNKNDVNLVYEINKVINETYYSPDYKLNIRNKFKLDDVFTMYIESGYTLDTFPNILDIYPYIPNVSGEEFIALKLKVHLFYLNTLLHWNNIEPLNIIDLNHIDIDIESIKKSVVNLISNFAYFTYLIKGKELVTRTKGFEFETINEENINVVVEIPFKNATNNKYYKNFKESLVLKHDTTSILNKLAQLIETSFKNLVNSNKLSSIDNINKQIKEILISIWNRIRNVPAHDILDVLLKLYDQLNAYNENNNIMNIAELVLKTTDLIHSNLKHINENLLMKYKKSIKNIHIEMASHQYIQNKEDYNYYKGAGTLFAETLNAGDTSGNNVTLYLSPKDKFDKLEMLKSKMREYILKMNTQILYTNISINDNELGSRISQALLQKLPKRFKSPFSLFHYELNQNSQRFISRDEAHDLFDEMSKRFSNDYEYNFTINLVNPILKKEKVEGVNPNESVFLKYLIKKAKEADANGNTRIDLNWDPNTADDDLKNLVRLITDDDFNTIEKDILFTELDSTFSRKEINSPIDLQTRYNRELYIFLDIDGYSKNKYPVGIYKRNYDVKKIDLGDGMYNYVYDFYLEIDKKYSKTLTEGKNDIYIYVGNDYWIILKKDPNGTYFDHWEKNETGSIYWKNPMVLDLKNKTDIWINNITTELVYLIRKYNGKYVPEEVINVFNHDDYDIFKRDPTLVNKIISSVKYESEWVNSLMNYYRTFVSKIKKDLFIKQTRLLFGVDISNVISNIILNREDTPSPLEIYNAIYPTSPISIPTDLEERREKEKRLSYVLPVFIHVYFDDSQRASNQEITGISKTSDKNKYSMFTENEKELATKLTNEYNKIVKNDETKTLISAEDILKRIQEQKNIIAQSKTTGLKQIRKDYQELKKGMEGEPTRDVFSDLNN